MTKASIFGNSVLHLNSGIFKAWIIIHWFNFLFCSHFNEGVFCNIDLTYHIHNARAVGKCERESSVGFGSWEKIDKLITFYCLFFLSGFQLFQMPFQKFDCRMVILKKGRKTCYRKAKIKVIFLSLTHTLKISGCHVIDHQGKQDNSYI